MITAEWANEEKSIVRWHFIGNWTWDEFHDAQKEVAAMIDTVDGIVDGIVITSQNQNMPAGALTYMRRILNQKHPRYGLGVVIGARLFLSTMLSLVPEFKQHESLLYADTEAEAVKLIEKIQEKRREQSASGQVSDF